MSHSFLLGVRMVTRILAGIRNRRSGLTYCNMVTDKCCLYVINRGSYMSAHVLLNLINELGKRDKMRGLLSILSLFRNEFNKFNNTRARM